MFNVSATLKPGKCPARRCSGDPFAAVKDGTNLNPYALCARHVREWAEAGRPELAPPAPITREAEALPGASNGTALAKIPLEAEIEIKRTEARAALARCQQFQIATQADADTAGTIMGALKQRKQALEAQRVEITKPMNEALRKVNQLFKPVIEYYDSCERALKGALSGFLLAQQQAQDTALAAIEAAGGEVVGEVLTVAHGIENVQAPASCSTRTVWKVTAVDRAKLPADYLIPDMSRIEVEVRRLGADFDVPGVSIERDIQIINRA